jgi:tetrahydromethanopterin S-methyltransferase subunit G
MTVMPMPREKWTDERLDDLNKKVDKGFSETKAEMREGFARVDADIRELRGEISGLNDRFDALNGRLLAGFFVIVAAIIGSNAFF